MADLVLSSRLHPTHIQLPSDNQAMNDQGTSEGSNSPNVTTTHNCMNCGQHATFILLLCITPGILYYLLPIMLLEAPFMSFILADRMFATYMHIMQFGTSLYYALSESWSTSTPFDIQYALRPAVCEVRFLRESILLLPFIHNGVHRIVLRLFLQKGYQPHWRQNAPLLPRRLCIQCAHPDLSQSGDASSTASPL